MRHFSYLIISIVFLSASCRTNKGISEKPSAKQSSISKYENILGIRLTGSINETFLEFVSNWFGVPYKYGGNSPEGTDCSGFVSITYKHVFGISLPRVSALQHQNSRKIKEQDLEMGDLLFFTIDASKISHVGMFLTQDYFIHASTKKGVTVNSLMEPYYSKHFQAFGTYR